MFKNTTISNFNQSLNTVIRSISNLIERSWGNLISNRNKNIEYRAAYTPLIHSLLTIALQKAKESPEEFIDDLQKLSPDYFDFKDSYCKFEFAEELKILLKDWETSDIYKKFEKKIIKRNKSKLLSLDKIKRMERHGASQSEIADYFGVSRTTIRDFKKKKEKT